MICFIVNFKNRLLQLYHTFNVKHTLTSKSEINKPVKYPFAQHIKSSARL